MSQSATLYRISNDTFRQLETTANSPQFEMSSAKNYTIFEGSFMGLEFVLSKGEDSSTTEIINEIFNPTQTLGGQDIEKLPLEEQLELYENGGVIYYWDTKTIAKLNDLLDTFSEADIQAKYDANELNDNGIYPSVWHDDNSEDQAYNSRHILEDFTNLKTIISQARQDNDYIIVFVG